MADGKWIEGLEATTPLTEAARQVLTVRFQVVADRLPSVIDATDAEIEHVHQLRVATRRADAALKIFRGCLPKKAYRLNRERLRRIRRAAGAARDWDVFEAELQARLATAATAEQRGLEYLVGYAMGQRDAAQPVLLSVAQAEIAEFGPATETLLASLQASVNPAELLLRDLAGSLLGLLHTNLELAIAADLSDYENLHRVRIQGKRLRYAMEVFAGCFDEPFREQLYPRIGEMQEILGRANDSHIACGRLTPLRQRLKKHRKDLWKPAQPGIDALLRYHQRRLPQERKKFLAWWTRWQKSGGEALRSAVLSSSEG